MVTPTASYYYLADGLGSTMAMVDSTGMVQKSYTYDVYDKPTATGALPNEYDFAGQQTDPTGLQYLRARYMDPETGTFVSREPLALAPGWTGSPYGYGAANPARVTDPTGLCGYYGDPADPWCKEQENPKDNVNDSYRPSRDTASQSKVEGAFRSLMQFASDVVRENGELERARLDAALAQGQLIAGCLSDLVCSTTVSGLLHGLSRLPIFGGVFETIAQVWDLASQAMQDLPGVYPRSKPGETIPASTDLIGEGGCP